ncbi:MAG: ABC transporter permease [Candidatus Ornithomonoglobus sp.]
MLKTKIAKKEKKQEGTGRSLWQKISIQKQLIFMSVPFLIHRIIFSYVPLKGWVMAFQNYKPSKGWFEQEWVGLKWFKQLFSDAVFITDIRNTLAMSIINLSLGFITAIVLALLLNEIKNSFAKRFIQTVSYMPHFLSWVIVAGLVQNMLSTESGIVNDILLKLGMTDRAIPFLSEPKYFWGIVGVSNVWKEVGWNTIIYLAAMSSIDPSLYEACEMDGGGRYMKMLHITLPGIKTTFMMLLIMNIGHVLEAGFEIQYLLGNGLISSVSETIDIYVLKYGIQIGNYSLGTAAGIFKSVVSIILIVIANKLAGEENRLI